MRKHNDELDLELMEGEELTAEMIDELTNGKEEGEEDE